MSRRGFYPSCRVCPSGRPVFDNTPELVESLTDSFTDAKLLLTDAGFHCIICELTGLEVNRYNKGVTNYCKHQDIIDEAIPILNIYAMNYDSLPTPFIQDSIHHKVKKTDLRRKTKYAKFKDGLRPDEKTARVWLDQIYAESYQQDLPISNCII